MRPPSPSTQSVLSKGSRLAFIRRLLPQRLLLQRPFLQCLLPQCLFLQHLFPFPQRLFLQYLFPSPQRLFPQRAPTVGSRASVSPVWRAGP